MQTVYFDMASRAIADVVEIGPNHYLITRINTPKAFRGKGLASQLLKEITEEADTERATLEIHPMSSGALSKKQLLSWYRRYGFYAQEPHGILIREPQVSGGNSYE